MTNFILENVINKIKKNIIQESKLDSVINKIYRDIIKNFKIKNNFVENYYFERANDYADIKLKCKFIRDKEFNYPFSISANAEFDNMEIEITYRPQDFPKNMVNLTAEVKETITHEIEHIGQHNFEDMYIIPKKYESYIEYLTSPEEVSAYVKGLIERARFKRISFNDSMQEWFQENINNFENPTKQWPKVKKTWLDYANKMREKNKVKKFN